jgi:hypothetical protein
MFIVRLMLVLAVAAGLGLAALYALGTFVAPEQREVQVTLPLPKPRG